MTAANTEAVLTVFWKGEERPGFSCYGYWPSNREPAVPFPAELWPAGTVYTDRWLRDWREGEEAWRVLERTVLVPRWPEAERWLENVHQTLGAFVRMQAPVAWCATEGHFTDPPELFDPGAMEGGMWAVYGQDLAFECTAKPGRPYAALSGEALETVRRYADARAPPEKP